MATSAEPVGAPSPFGGLSGKGAADILQGLASAALFSRQPAAPCLGQVVEHADDAGGCDGLGPSRKDKSLGLLCDNFLKNFASGGNWLIELEPVAEQLSVGRRRIYDIVNVLESLNVVSKHKASVYSWLGMDNLPATIEALERDWATERADDVKLLTDAANPGVCGSAEPTTEQENAGSECSKENAANLATSSMLAAADTSAVAEDPARRPPKSGPKNSDKDRKEKSIRELSLKFIGLFMQAVRSPELGGILSLEQAARSLLKHELHTEAGAAAHVEPDANAMKTKVRRLYDICNVLTSLKMIEKVKLRGTNKPAFKWLGVTTATHLIFDARDARSRVVKQYGGGDATAAVVPARPGAKRSLTGAAGRRVAPKAHAALDPHYGQALCTPLGWVQGAAVPAADAEALVALQNLQGHGDALLRGDAAALVPPRAAVARAAGGAPIARQETEVCYQRTAVVLSERAEHATYLQLLRDRSNVVQSTHPVVVAATAVDAPLPGVAMALPRRLDPESSASGAGKLGPRACALPLTCDDWPEWGAASETSGDDQEVASGVVDSEDRSEEGNQE